MSAPVDVLDVLRRAHVAFSGKRAMEIYETELAVGKLIEDAQLALELLESEGHGNTAGILRNSIARVRGES